MSWWQGRMCAFDLESTAADPEEARIVTASVVTVGAGLPAEIVTLLADPGVPIPEEATAVHGITNEQAATGEPALEVTRAVCKLLRAAEPMPLVIFNARYDLTVLDRECRRHGLEPYEPLYVVDPLVIDKHLDRYRRGSRKLTDMCEHHGATLDGAHDASYDALAAARLAYRLGRSGEVKRKTRNYAEFQALGDLIAEWEDVRYSLPKLHEAQKLWAADQAQGLADYFRAKGQHEDAAGVRLEWPLVPC